MSANVVALSQENRRFLSCHGQISCTSFPPSKPMAAGSHRRAYCNEAPRSRCPASPCRLSCEQTGVTRPSIRSDIVTKSQGAFNGDSPDEADAAGCRDGGHCDVPDPASPGGGDREDEAGGRYDRSL